MYRSLVRSVVQIQGENLVNLSSVNTSTVLFFDAVIYIVSSFATVVMNTCIAIIIYAGLDSTVKNMVTSLRAVGELQNSAIRDRHWLQLMQATQVILLLVIHVA